MAELLHWHITLVIWWWVVLRHFAERAVAEGERCQRRREIIKRRSRLRVPVVERWQGTHTDWLQEVQNKSRFSLHERAAGAWWPIPLCHEVECVAESVQLNVGRTNLRWLSAICRYCSAGSSKKKTIWHKTLPEFNDFTLLTRFNL